MYSWTKYWFNPVTVKEQYVHASIQVTATSGKLDFDTKVEILCCRACASCWRDEGGGVILKSSGIVSDYNLF